MGRSKEELIQAAAQGDASAVEALLERYLPLVKAAVSRKLGRAIRSREETVDIAQSVCRQALENLDKVEYRGDEQFKGWLLAITDKKIVDRHRELLAAKRDVRREVALKPQASTSNLGGPRDLADAGSTPSMKVSRQEEVDRVRQAIHSLPEELQEALRLHQFEQLPYDEVAKRTGSTLKQARWRVYKAKLRLAEILKQPDA